MKTTIYDLGLAGRFRIVEHELGAALQVPGMLWTWETVRFFTDDMSAQKILLSYARRKYENHLYNIFNAAAFVDCSPEEKTAVKPGWQSIMELAGQFSDNDTAIPEFFGTGMAEHTLSRQEAYNGLLRSGALHGAPTMPNAPLTATALSLLPCRDCSRFGNGVCSAKLARPKHGACKMRKEPGNI